MYYTYHMNLKTWFNSKPIWLRYGIIGAIVYPLIIIILMMLSFISSLIRLNFIFETIEGIIIFPAYIISNKLINILFISESFNEFRIYYLVLNLIITIILGFIIGLVIGKIKSKNK